MRAHSSEPPPPPALPAALVGMGEGGRPLLCGCRCCCCCGGAAAAALTLMRRSLPRFGVDDGRRGQARFCSVTF